MKTETREEKLENALSDLLGYLNLVAQDDNKIDFTTRSIQKALRILYADIIKENA